MHGKKQSKKTFNSADLQISPRITSPRQGNVLVLLPYSQSFHLIGTGFMSVLREPFIPFLTSPGTLKDQQSP